MYLSNLTPPIFYKDHYTLFINTFQAIYIINNAQICQRILALFLVYLCIEITPYIMYYNINK
nr:MAG TPA: hypothetical protein [Caudoviricetes sp.]